VEEAVRAALLDDEGKAPSPQSVAKPTYLDATAKSTADDSLLPFLEAQLKPLPSTQPWHDRTPVRRRRFYRKDDVDDNERRTGVLYRSKRDAGEISVEDSSDDEDSDTDSDEDLQRPQKATWDASKYVDFATFERWHREVRSRRPAVLRCLHAIDATRLRQRRRWVVLFSILRPFSRTGLHGTKKARAGHVLDAN